MTRIKGTLSSKNKDIFYIGATFGEWTIVSIDIIHKGVQNHGHLLCRCSCGEEKLVVPYSLKKGISTKCIKCSKSNRGENHPSFTGYKNIPGSWFTRYVNRKNKWDFDITIKDVYNIWVSQNRKCKLSGLDIDFENQNFRKISNRESRKKLGKKYDYDLKCTASLDRIDSNKGYTKNNIQLVHKDINMMKKEYEQDYYIKMCGLVSKNSEIV